jgi:hypothetical protein
VAENCEKEEGADNMVVRGIVFERERGLVGFNYVNK